MEEQVNSYFIGVGIEISIRSRVWHVAMDLLP